MYDKRPAGFHSVPDLLRAPDTHSSTRLRYSGNTYIDIGYFVPCGIVGNAGLGQIEDALEGTNRFRSGGTVESVCRNGWNCRIVTCNTIQLVL